MVRGNCCCSNRFGRMGLGMKVPGPHAFAAALFLALGLGACPAERAMQVPPGQPQVVSQNPAGSSQEPAKTAREPVISDPAEVGTACFLGSECVSTICEGASCDGSTPGTCAPEDRVCTADVVEYCGCDGKTFVSSSSCPGEAFAKMGRCDAP
jgi:hypothetical protein